MRSSKEVIDLLSFLSTELLQLSCENQQRVQCSQPDDTSQSDQVAVSYLPLMKPLYPYRLAYPPCQKQGAHVWIC